MKSWLKWAVIGAALALSMVAGAMLGTLGKTRPTDAPEVVKISKEEKERSKIMLTLLTTGPIPASKMKLHLVADPEWTVTVDAESKDGKLATVLEDARGLFLALSNTGVPIRRATVRLTTSALRDQYGRPIKDLQAARIGFGKETWAKIDWSGFDPRNYYAVAEEYWLHPLLQKQAMPPPRPDNAAMLGQ